MSADTQQGLKVLLVEDTEVNREVTIQRLLKRGIKCEGTPSSEQALKLLSEFQYDAILLDIMLPGMNGIDLLRMIRETYPANELPVIMVTGLHEDTKIAEAFDLGANDYITKPINVPLLVTRLRGAIEICRLSKNLRKQKAISAHQNQLEKIITLGTGIAHEVNNPLMIYSGASQIALIKLESNSTTDEMVKFSFKSKSCIDRLDRILTGLAEFSGIQPHTVSTTNTQDLIGIALNYFQTLPNNLDIQFKYEDYSEDCHVSGSAKQFEKVIKEIIDNAVQAVSEEETRWIKIRVSTEDNHLTMNISNSGKTIADDAEKIFEPFYTTYEKNHIGLGLSIASGITTFLNGSVSYSGDQGQCQFTLRFPTLKAS